MINEELLNEIEEYCRLNDEDLEKTINKAIRNGFTAIKFGSTPILPKVGKKPLEPLKKPEIVTIEPIKPEIIKPEPIKEVIELKPVSKTKNNNNKDIYGEE
tara:strand:+ start:320 stop:622 length:303 start_codon:yes stop_codon:yes gene_type:complete